MFFTKSSKIDGFRRIEKRVLFREMSHVAQPNSFARRLEWHTRVVDFEKKFEVIRPTRSLSPDLSLLSRNLTPEFTMELVDSKSKCHYKNHLYCSTMRCGDITEYFVTLVLDNADDLYDDVEETRVFDTEQDALQSFNDLIHLKTMYPNSALSVFKNY